MDSILLFSSLSIAFQKGDVFCQEKLSDILRYLYGCAIYLEHLLPPQQPFKVWIGILNTKEWFSLFVLQCNSYCDSKFKDLVWV